MKSLDSKIYTKKYFLGDCSDFEEFNQYFGKKLGPRLTYVLSHIKIKKGMRILDIGCGRGEVAFWAARQGAKVIGIDYSEAAIKLANNALKKQSKRIKQNVEFRVENAKEIKLPIKSFDIIFLIDVLEHLYTDEQNIVLKKCYELLKNRGIIFAHTEPNKIYVDFVYPYWSYPISTLFINIWKILTNKKYPNITHPSKLRTKSHKIMHINEPTYLHLQKIFKENKFKPQIYSKNFKIKSIISWKDILYNLVVFLFPLSKWFPFNRFFAEDFIVIAKKN